MTKSKHFPWTQLEWEAELLFGLQAIQWHTDTMGRGHLRWWRNARQIKSQYVLHCGSGICTTLSKPATLFLVLSQGSFALHNQMDTICIPNTCYINICYLLVLLWALQIHLGCASWSRYWAHLVVFSSPSLWLPLWLLTEVSLYFSSQLTK